MPEFKSIHDQWDEYRTAVYRGVEVSKVQHDETQQAFFAGALTILEMMASVGDMEMTDDEIRALLSSLHEEAIEFHREKIRKHTEQN